MNNKKEVEREELHKTIWKIANELRGSVDGWDFKQYVLGLLFYRFISENIENYVNDNQRKTGLENFEYKNISDEEALLGKTQILEEKGLFILPSELFCNVRKNADKNENLNVVISNIFNNIESSARGTASEDDVKGLFDDFTIDNKLGNTVDERNQKLVKLLNAIGDLNFGDYEENKIDLFVGGSPCQSFSVIGSRGGFEDARGTLFYEYARLVKEIEPKVFIYENVYGVLTHDKGNTWKVMQNIFNKLGYYYKWQILNAKDCEKFLKNIQCIWLLSLNIKRKDNNDYVNLQSENFHIKQFL